MNVMNDKSTTYTKEVYRFYEGETPIYFYNSEEMVRPKKDKIPHQSLFGFGNGTYFKIDRFVSKKEIRYTLPGNLQDLNLITYDYLIMKENIEIPDISELGYELQQKTDSETIFVSKDKKYPHYITIFSYFLTSPNGTANKHQTFVVSTKRYTTKAYPITELQMVIDRIPQLFKTKD